MKFNYQARTAQGAIQTGTVEATNRDIAIETLHRYGLIILEIIEEKKGFGLSLGEELPFLNRVKTQDIVIFSRQLAVLFDAQVPLVQALRTLADQATPTLKKIIMEIAGDVDDDFIAGREGFSILQRVARFWIRFANVGIDAVMQHAYFAAEFGWVNAPLPEGGSDAPIHRFEGE